MMTFQQLADQRIPDAVYDWAVPQEWFNLVLDRINRNPTGHVVWLYPPGSICGRPFGITLLGGIICRLMDIHNELNRRKL